MWIIYLAVPVGSTLMCLRFLQALRAYWRTGELAHHDHAAVDGVEGLSDLEDMPPIDERSEVRR